VSSLTFWLLPPHTRTQIFFACLAIFSTTGASAIGYVYVAEVPTQRLRAISASYGLAITNLVAIMFSFVAPILIKGSGDFKGWKAKTGFLWVTTGSIRHVLGACTQVGTDKETLYGSYAGTGIPTVVLAYFIVPEVARRSPAEIDERGFSHRAVSAHRVNGDGWLKGSPYLAVFESGISLRKFKGHKTEVELNHEARNVEHDAW
jgi:SP family general alpha glucoside:H+ symporter-like MFS transporter